MLMRDDHNLAAAGRTAGTLLHPREHEALLLHKIDARVRKHHIRPVFQEHPEAILLQGRIALLGGFGYVHSQRGASAAGDEEYSHPVAWAALLVHNLFEFIYCAVRQTDHYFLLLDRPRQIPR